jgi:hypothetical protein
MLVLFSGVHCNFIDIDIKKDRFIIQAHTFLASMKMNGIEASTANTFLFYSEGS